MSQSTCRALRGERRQPSSFAHGYNFVSSMISNKVTFAGGSTQKLSRIWICESKHSAPAAGHVVQSSLLRSKWYVLAGQLVQEAPSVSTKSPPAHFVHSTEPTGAIEPRGQGAHAKKPFAVSALYVPASHAPQKSAYSSRTCPSLHE